MQTQQFKLESFLNAQEFNIQYLPYIDNREPISKPMQNQQPRPDDNKQNSNQKQQVQPDPPSVIPKIMSKSEQINFLITQKNYIKVKVHSHFTLPTIKDAQNNAKNKVMLVPASYTVFKLKQQIKKNFDINQKQAIFLFVKSQKIVQSTLTVKEMFNKFVNGSTLVNCLELSAYNSEFS